MPSAYQSIRVAPWIIVFVLCSVYLGAVYVANDASPLTFVTPGTRFMENDPQGTEGYDGQFVYFIAADPQGAAQFIDVPAYRYQRILLPVLARLLAFGQEAMLPWSLLFINLASLVGSTFILERLLIAQGASRWYALSYGLFAGVFMAVRLSLNEPLAYGLVILGIWLERRESILLPSVAFALAALGKETTLLFVAGYGLWLVIQQRWRDGLLFGLLAGIPFGVWQIVLFTRFGQFGIGSGGAMATPFEWFPYNGFWRIYTDTGEAVVFAVFAILLLPSAILPSLWALYASLRSILRKNYHPYIFLLLANAAIMPFVPFSTYREPLGIFRFITGLVISTVLYGAYTRHQRVLRYSTLWILLLLFAVNSG